MKTKKLLSLFAVSVFLSSILLSCDNNDDYVNEVNYAELEAVKKEDLEHPGDSK